MKIPITHGIIASPNQIDLSAFSDSSVLIIKPSIDHVIALVAREFGIGPRNLTAKSRRQPIAWYRQIAMHLCFSKLIGSSSKIGKAFGGRYHTTVLHASKRVRDIMEVDAQAREQVRKLEAAIQRV